MNQLTNYWLSILCRMIKGATSAVVFSAAQDKSSYIPTAYWPEDKHAIQYAIPAVKTVLSKKQCLLLQQNKTNIDEETGEPYDIIACPLFLDEQFYGVVVVQTSSRTSAKQQAAMQQIQGAAIWFEVLVKQYFSTEKKGLVIVVEFVASCLEHERFQAAATDVLTDFATRLSCERVSLGLLHGNSVTVEAVSHSASFDRKSSLIRDIGEAMQEAMDQNSTTVYPETTDAVLLTRCHTALSRDHKIGTILTVPFVAGGKIAGAVLVERPSDQPFDQTTIEYFEQIISMIGPVLEMRNRDEQYLWRRISNSLKRSVINVFGPGHPALKLGFSIFILCFAILVFTSGNYRITGGARLTALTQRVVVAPQDGYILIANVRPGDIVHTGDILGALDDKDLKLERRKWSSQLVQLQSESRDALARHDRSKVSILNAKRLQAEAQLNLVDEQLARTRFPAPFDGLIVSGDLSQALGSPVERGQVLFTVAPLDAYRVILKIDERDIGDVTVGQGGNLILSGMPRKPFHFTVEKITPVLVAEGGRNFFQVEAKMEKNSDLLRPGMEGVAKIDIDRRKLIWIWTHKLVDWARLSTWAWRP